MMYVVSYIFIFYCKFNKLKIKMYVFQIKRKKIIQKKANKVNKKRKKKKVYTSYIF